MKLTLVKKEAEVPGVTTFIFQPDNPLVWRAGQFLRYHIPNPSPDERGANRFFTIASSPFEKNIQVTTRFDSEHGSSFKNDLISLNEGAQIDAEGPMGSFVIEDVFISEEKKLCFIAGGIGITPFRSILLDLDQKGLPINVTLLYANRDQNIVFKDEFDKLAQKYPTFKVHYIIDPQKIDEDLIKSLILNLQSSIFYISGPAPMVKALESTLERMGVGEDNINHDYFPGYDRI